LNISTKITLGKNGKWENCSRNCEHIKRRWWSLSGA
jgi:hypothetical protein